MAALPKDQKASADPTPIRFRAIRRNGVALDSGLIRGLVAIPDGTVLVYLIDATKVPLPLGTFEAAKKFVDYHCLNEVTPSTISAFDSK